MLTTSFSKVVDGSFVLGFLLPAVLGLISAAWAFPDGPLLKDVLSKLASQKSLGDVTYIVLAMWLLAVFLVALNDALYALLKGYAPPVSWLTFLKEHHVRRFTKLHVELDELHKRWSDEDAFSLNLQARLAQLQVTLLSEYPSYRDEVLPTTFGNRIRAFEVYPRQAYGADSISIDFRLPSVISKDFQLLITSARTQVDFLVNLFYISLFLAQEWRVLGRFLVASACRR